MKARTKNTKGFGDLKYTGLGLAVLVGGSAVCALPTAVLAQQIEEIIVTATKRETRLQDTPMSIAALGSDTLTKLNVDNFTDFFQMVPGFSAIDAGPGDRRYSVRGLQSIGEPQVGLYYDEIPIAGLPGDDLDSGNAQPDVKMWDMERVEVLRGPQGTLYGNGSMGGTMRFISKKPVLEEYQSSAQLSLADTKGGDFSWRLNGMVNVPIVPDKFGVRVAAYYRNEGGWIDDPLISTISLPQINQDNINDEKTWGGRVSAKLQATDTWTLTGVAYYQDTETGSKFDVQPSFNTGGSKWVSKFFVAQPIDDKLKMFNLISEHDLGWANLLATVSYQDRGFDRNEDTTRFVLGIFGCDEFTWNVSCFGPPFVPTNSFGREETDAWSGEVRMVSTAEGPFQWTVGAFWQDRDTYRRGQVAVVSPPSLLITFNPTTGDANGRIFARTNVGTFKQEAVFGEGTYAITEQLKATVGLRWFQVKRTESQELLQGFFGETPGVQPLQSFKEDKLVTKFHLAYDVSDDALIYAQASQGFRVGGPNQPGGFDLAAPPYNADSVWNYEAGLKSSFNDDSLIFNLSIFNIEWSDLQSSIEDETGAFQYIGNFSKARSQGVEVELNARLTEGFDWLNGISYTKAHLVGDQPQAALDINQGRDGDLLPGVPQWTANSSAIYTWPIANDYTMSARLDLVHASGRGSVFRTDSPLYIKTKGYELVNLRLNLEQEENWRMSLNVDNVFNSFAVYSARILDEVPVISAARPRTVTLVVQTNF